MGVGFGGPTTITVALGDGLGLGVPDGDGFGVFDFSGSGERFGSELATLAVGTGVAGVAASWGVGAGVVWPA